MQAACALVVICTGTICAVSLAREVPPALNVDVRTSQPGSPSVSVPVSFAAPMDRRDLAPGASQYLVSSEGVIHACQVEPFGEPPVDRGYRWANLSASLPPVDERYTLLVAHESTRPKVPIAGAMSVSPSEVILFTESTRVSLSTWRFRVLDAVEVGSRQVVPPYVEGLINPQQGMALVVTDTYRYADFTMKARAVDDGFSMSARGPTRASAIYSGAFKHEYIDDIPFDVTISLFSNDVIEITTSISQSAFDDDIYELKSVVITLPLVLESAARLSFGGDGHTVVGEKRWHGSAALHVDDGEGYRLEDAEGREISGKGPLSWVHYGSREGGAGFMWEPRCAPFSFEVADYDQDALVISMTPAEIESVGFVARAFVIFDDGFDKRIDLDALARALARPPRAQVDDRYVRYIMGVR